MWQCAKSDKSGKNSDRFERNNVSNNAVNGLGHWVCAACVDQTRKKTLTFSFVHSTARPHSRETVKHVTVRNCNPFFHSWQQQKKNSAKKRTLRIFFSLSRFDFNGKYVEDSNGAVSREKTTRRNWIKLPEKRNRDREQIKSNNETKRNELPINYGWNELNIGNKPLCVVSLLGWAKLCCADVLTDGDRRRRHSSSSTVKCWTH